jgi:rfaE bifunctional protein kinase chain/domain
MRGEPLSVERERERERLLNVIRRFPERKVVVVGDLVADQFLYGEISRVSREAPVLILRHERTETTPGGAANCAANLAALGARVALVGVVGEDEAGSALLEKLCAAGVECDGVVSQPRSLTTTKTRILAGQIHSTRQQVLRVDYETEPPSDSSLRERLNARAIEEARAADAVIISDYNYGVADETLAEALREATGERKVPLLVDSRFRLTRFTNLTSATPNEDEVEHVLGRQLKDDKVLESAAEELRHRLSYQSLLVTRGGRGMLLLEAGAAPLHIEAIGSREPVDVTGAGDTVIATYALALASGADFSDAARLANHAGGLVVMKRGTASISSQELQSSLMRSTT